MGCATRQREGEGKATMDHSLYDKRRYPIVDVREGYDEWVRTYEHTVQDEMDLRLLERLEMLDVARAKDLYRMLAIADVTGTGLPDDASDLCVQSLADEHLPGLRPGRRAAHPAGRLLRPRGLPPAVPDGRGAHALRPDAGRADHDPQLRPSPEHHAKAAHASGWTLLEMDEALVDEAWLRKKPTWERRGYLGLPISFAMVWQRRLP